jgi:hypothetical protein
MMATKEKLTAQADAMLKAGDALSRQFPAESKRLLRLCSKYRIKARATPSGRSD